MLKTLNQMRDGDPRYDERAITLIEAGGGRVVYHRRVQSSLIAPVGEECDMGFLVEQPSRHVLRDMLTGEEYRAIVPHRTQLYRISD